MWAVQQAGVEGAGGGRVWQGTLDPSTLCGVHSSSGLEGAQRKEVFRDKDSRESNVEEACGR